MSIMEVEPTPNFVGGDALPFLPRPRNGEADSAMAGELVLASAYADENPWTLTSEPDTYDSYEASQWASGAMDAGIEDYNEEEAARVELAGGRGLTEQSKQLLDGLGANERLFVRKVEWGVREALERDPEALATVLFDIDGTLMPLSEKASGMREGEIGVRAGLPVLLQRLWEQYGRKVEVGLLSTHSKARRGDSAAEDKMAQDAGVLFGRWKYMYNPDYGLSSHGGQFPAVEHIERQNDGRRMIELARPIVRANVMAEFKGGPGRQGDFLRWDRKTGVLSCLVDEDTNRRYGNRALFDRSRTYVVVDDLAEYVEAIEHKRIIGVPLPPGRGNISAIPLKTDSAYAHIRPVNQHGLLPKDVRDRLLDEALANFDF